jgi:hypothetical protein
VQRHPRQEPLQQSVDFLHTMLCIGKQHRRAYRPHQRLQHWALDVHQSPRGLQDDCAATGRVLRTPTVSITNTARFLKIRKRDIAFLLLIVLTLTR